VLSDSQRRELADLVFQGLGANPAQVITAVIGIELARTLPNFPVAYEIAQWVVDVALRQDTGDVFVKVVRSFDAAGRLTEMWALVARLQGDPSSWRVHRGAYTWIGDQSAFVDRVNLQTLLVSMAGGAGPAAITIEGASGDGKTTICDYIEKLASDLRGFTPVIEHVEAETASTLSPALLANRLHLKLGGHGVLTTTAVEPERVASNLAQDLAQRAITAPAPVWFVVDGVDTPGLPVAVLRLVDELLRWVGESADIARGLRVVLLGANLAGVDLPHLPLPAGRNNLPDVDLAVIRDWFEAAVPGKPPILYALTADSVFRELPSKTGPNGANRMRSLRILVEAAHGELLNA
jgi:hypothetical protein